MFYVSVVRGENVPIVASCQSYDDALIVADALERAGWSVFAVPAESYVSPSERPADYWDTEL